MNKVVKRKKAKVAWLQIRTTPKDKELIIKAKEKFGVDNASALVKFLLNQYVNN